MNPVTNEECHFAAVDQSIWDLDTSDHSEDFDFCSRNLDLVAAYRTQVNISCLMVSIDWVTNMQYGTVLDKHRVTVPVGHS